VTEGALGTGGGTAIGRTSAPADRSATGASIELGGDPYPGHQATGLRRLKGDGQAVSGSQAPATKCPR